MLLLHHVDYAGKSEYGSVKATRTVYRDKSFGAMGMLSLSEPEKPAIP